MMHLTKHNSMIEIKCCKRTLQRSYYFIVVAILTIILIIHIITLGTFGVQFSRTRSFWKQHVDLSATKVCVLYGKGNIEGSPNPMLINNASCGFILWALTTSIFVMLAWIASQVTMGLLGRPEIISLLRLVDLITSVCLAFLSLIISAVLTDGLKKTCEGFSASILKCSARKFISHVDGEKKLSFHQHLDAALDMSWVVTLSMVFLALWYGALIAGYYNIIKYGKARDKKKELPDFPAEGSNILEHNNRPDELNPQPDEHPDELNPQPDELNQEPDELNQQPDELNQQPDQLNQKPRELNQQPDELNQQPDELNKQPDELNQQPDELNQQPDEQPAKLNPFDD